MLDLTCDPDLQELKSAILGDAVVDEYLAGLNRRSIAIVFSGGGGKGAYEAGVMLALFDCGITKFCALSGTSVGALNAVLFHELCRTGSRDSILQLWCDISPWKVMHPTWKSVVAVVAKAAVLAALVLIYATSFPHMRAQDREFIPVSEKGQFRRLTQNFLQAYFRLVLLLLTSGLTAWMAWIFYSTWIAWIFYSISLTSARSEVVYGLLVTAYVLLYVTVFSWLMASLKMYRTRLASRFSFMTNAPLRKAISEFDTNGIHGSTTAIYCTTTASSSYFDPFVSRFKGQITEQLIPFYVQLNLVKTKNEITDILMQTAALPEIFPTMKLSRNQINRSCLESNFIPDSFYVVDGGLTDNTPIFPVLSHSPNVIMSVYLKRKFARGSQLIPSESRRIFAIAERLARANLSYEMANKIHSAWRSARLRARLKWSDSDADADFTDWFLGRDDMFVGQDIDKPTVLRETNRLEGIELVAIIPSAPIDVPPRFVTGTMNFCAKKAQRLIRLGYKDTLEQLRCEAYRVYPGS